MNPPIPCSSKPGERKIENLQALRGVAILFVVLHHIGRYEERFVEGAPLFQVLARVGWCGVDLFFVISGFVMSFITRGRFQRPDGTKIFWLRRAGRIYPLYWFFTLLYLPIFLFVPAWMNRPGGDAEISVLCSFLLLPQNVAPIVGQGWTLVFEMFFYLVFGLLLLFPERHKLKLLGLWAVLIVGTRYLCEAGVISRQSGFLKLATSLMILEFIAGCFVAEIVSADVHKGAFLATVVGLLALCTVAALTNIYDWSHILWEPTILCLIPSAFVVYGSVALEWHSHIIFPRFLRFAGDISYSMYLSHLAALLVWNKVFHALHLGGGPVFHVLYFLVAFGLMVGVASASYFWVEKPLLKLAYALIPGVVAFIHRQRARFRGFASRDGAT